MTDPARHPYVALGRNGLVKVGMSIDVEKRAQSLRKEFKAKGDELCTIESCEKIPRARGVEWALIHHCEKQFARHSGREWFVGADFRTLVDLARKLTEEMRDQPAFIWTAEDQARATARRAQVMAERRVRAEDNKVRQAARSARARMKREKSARVISAFVAFAAKA